MAGQGRRTQLLAAVALAGSIVVAAVSAVHQARADSVTYDERGYLQAGSCTARGGAIDAIDTTNPPFFRIPAGLVVAAVDDRSSGCEDALDVDRPPAELRALVLRARLPNVAVAAALVAVLGLWVRVMAGPVAGAVAASIASLEPTLLGHGHLVTGDGWMAAGVVATLAAAWASRHARTDVASVAWAAAAGAALGFGLHGKASALVVAPAILVAELLHRDRLRRAAVRAVAAGAAALLVLWAPYLVWDQRPDDGERRLAAIELGLPGAWVRGLRFQLDHASEGAGDSNWFAGASHPAERVPAYYVTGVATKGSPVLLGGLVAAVVAAVFRRRRAADGPRGTVLVDLVLPAVAVIAAPSLGVIHIGIRYALPAFALLAGVAAIGIVRVASAGRGRLRAAVVVVAALLAVPSVAAARNSGISYFNPLAGDEPERLLADSNLDWGQDAWRVRSWWSAAGRPTLVDATFAPLPLSTYGVTVVEGEGSCGDLVAVSNHRRVLGQVPPLGARVTTISPATAVYQRGC